MSQQPERATEPAVQEEAHAPSPNTKLHGEPPPGSPMPGAENPDSDTVNQEIKPNTE